MRNECQSKNPDTCRVHGVKKLATPTPESQQLTSPDEKYCKGCDTTKPVSEFTKRGNSYRSMCKKCTYQENRAKQIAKMSSEEKARIKRYEEKKALEEQGFRACIRCKDNKPLNEYYSKLGKLTYQVCKACRPAHQKEYLAANPEVEKQRRSKDKLYRQMVLDYTQPLKEAGCADCKRHFPGSMDFDHTCPPEEKLYNITNIHTYGGASTNLLEMLKTELAKGEYVCRNCHRNRTAQRHKSNRRIHYLANPSSDKINERAKVAYEHLNNTPCIDCNETNFIALEFDHVIGQKKADIAQMIGATAKFTVQDVKDEITKCEVRCGNCHQKKTTARANGLESTHQETKEFQSLVCPKCAGRKTRVAVVCYDCSRQEISEMTDKKYGNLENLLIQLRETSFVQVAKAYNVSDTAIRKYLKTKKVDIQTLRVLE